MLLQVLLISRKQFSFYDISTFASIDVQPSTRLTRILTDLVSSTCIWTIVSTSLEGL